MRRLIAYVLASLTIFLGIGVSFKPVATRINADLSYRSGSTISFRLEERENGKKLDEFDKPAQYYADIMESRLMSYGVSDYKVVTEGNKFINVTLTADNQKEYENIGNLLSINPIIEIANLPGKASNDEEKATEKRITDKENVKWHSSKAYLAFDGTTTVVVMPIPSGFKTEVEEMIKEAEKYEKTSKSSNDGEEKKTPNSIVLWMNRLDGEDYAKKENPLIKKKIIYDQMNSTNFYYGTNKDAFQIRFTPSSAKVSDISDAYKSAIYYMNLLNSSEAEFDCIVTNIQTCAPVVENLLIYGDHVHIAMSSTFISLMIGFILICLILALFYRLTAVAIISSSSLATFLSFTLFVLFKPLFGIASIVGIISIFAMSIFIGILYNNYLHEEIYKGRSLKKANYEASKKTTLVTVDLSVISMILGITTYFIGGKTVASAGVILIIFSIINLLVNTFILKGLMWLIANNTSTQKSYKLLGLDASKIPDLSKEEKQSYFGPYEKKNFLKKKKLFAIIFGGVTVASLVSVIVFSAVKHDVFNTDSYYATSNVYHLVLRSSNQTEPVTTEEIKNNYLSKVKNDGKDLKFNSEIETYNFKYYVKTTEGQGYETEYHYVYNIIITESNVDSLTYSCGSELTNQSLHAALASAFIDFTDISVDGLDECLIKSQAYNMPGNVGLIMCASIVTTVASGAYLWIRRYRLSRVLPLIGISLVSSVITIGLVSLTRIPATPVMAVSVVISTAFTLLAGQYIMHKEKDILRDERLRDLAVRKASLDKALHMGALPLINFGIIFAFSTVTSLAMINKSFSGVFFGSSLGIISSSLMLLTLFTPAADYLDSKLSKVHLPEIKIKKKKKVVVKSNEPEEAIFIGIND